MKTLRSKIKSIKIVKVFSSINITVVCLSLLFILTLWGTIAQVDNGLYQAQERYFYSWFFLAVNFFPFPGAKLILWILFFNLSCVAITRFVYHWKHGGILIIHCGLLLYFVSAFVTYHFSEESNLTLLETEGSNVSTAYHNWELSVWEEDKSTTRNVIAYDTDKLKSGQILSFEEFGFDVFVDSYYGNAQAYLARPEGIDSLLINDTGIKHLASLGLNKEPAKNLAGGIFKLLNQDRVIAKVLLYGGETQPTQIQVGKKTFNLMLRKKRFPLPFFVTLLDFKKELHPGTQIARSYESKVRLNYQDIERDTLIYMNEPLRYKTFTLYQASYSIDSLGRERSTLAVVNNVGRLLPYFACLVVVTGLLIHFLAMAFTAKKI